MRIFITVIIVFLSTTLFAQKDTTQKQVDTVGYSLSGSSKDFQLLMMAIAAHDDVTPNELKYLAAWIRRNAQPITKQKPKQ